MLRSVTIGPLVGSVLVVWLAAACSAAPPAATQAGATIPPSQPTARPSEAPLDTIPAPSATPGGDLGLACFASPTTVAPGETYSIAVMETGPWYGSDRFYEIIGIPEGYQTVQGTAGELTSRLIYRSVAGASGGWSIAVTMRDYDIHDIRPGGPLPGQSVRPESTHHEASCGTFIHVAFVP